MGEFFHGWRRKVGVSSLVMACVFMGVWVRSLTIIDIVTIRTLFGHTYSLKCENGELTWLHWIEDYRMQNGIYWVAHPQQLTAKRVVGESFKHPSPIRFTKLTIMYVPTATAKATGVVTSFWVIVIPLTVVSLLLFKPSKSSQMKIA